MFPVAPFPLATNVASSSPNPSGTWIKTLNQTHTRYGYLLETAEHVSFVQFFDDPIPQYIPTVHIQLVPSLAEEFFLV